MTQVEYEKLRAKIEDRYNQDLVALDHIWALFRGDEKPPEKVEAAKEAKPHARHKRLSRSAAMKASWARRRAGKANGDEKGLTQKQFSQFLGQRPSGRLRRWR